MRRVLAVAMLVGLGSALMAGVSIAKRDVAHGQRTCNAVNCDIYSVSADGTNRRRLTRTHESDARPALSRDGRKIAFNRFATRPDYIGGLWIANSDGSRPRRLADGGSTPRWSPDGTRIAYSTNANGVTESAVAIVDLAARRLFTISNGWDPTWSPEGKRLAFLSDLSPDWRVGYRTISIANADGTARRMLYQLGEQEFGPSSPAWSKRGLLAVSISSGPSGGLGPGLSIFDTETGERTSASDYGWQPAWSRDGRSIAFANGKGVWVEGSAPSEPRLLVRTGRSWVVPRFPAWSPDGRRIACLTARSLLVVNVRTGRVRVVAKNAVPAGAPAWSPNGRRIFYVGIA